MSTPARLSRVVLPTGALVALAALVAIATTMSPTLAVKGGYTLVGVGIAALLFYGLESDESASGQSETAPSWTWRTVYIVTALSISAAALTGERGLPLIAGTAIGFGLLAYQMRFSPSSGRFLAQVLSVFAINPVTKYLVTGFYFGGGDMFRHVRLVENLLRTGTVGGMDHFTYEVFPGLHLIAGAVANVAGIAAYDALMGLGAVVSLGLFLPTAYALGRLLGNDSTLANGVVLTLAALSSTHMYASYVFPQAVALPAVALLLFVVFRGESSGASRRRLSVLVPVLSCGLVVIHHFTLFLVAPFVVLATAAAQAVNRLHDKTGATVLGRRTISLLVASVIVLGYWTFIGEVFLVSLATAVVGMIEMLFFPTPASGGTVTYWYGLKPPEETLAVSVLKLGSWAGVYNALLVATVALGVVTVLERIGEYHDGIALLGTGFVASPLMIKLPVAIKSIDRIQNGLSVFFVLIAGVGVSRIARLKSFRGVAMAVLLVSAFGLSGAVIGGDDLNGIHDKRLVQKEYSYQEQAEFKTTAQFLRSTGTDVDTMWASSAMLSRLGVTSTNSVDLSPSGIEMTGQHLLYRERWTNHKVLTLHSSDGIATFDGAYMSDAVLDRAVARENQIYDGRSLGILWVEDRNVTLAE